MLDGEYPRNRAFLFVNYCNVLLWLALSHCREYAVDRGGTVLCGAPSKLSSALKKVNDEAHSASDDDMRQREKANPFLILSAVKPNA